jgi:VCPO second helical-bundle domain
MISRLLVIVAVAAAALALGASTGRAVTLPPGNAAQQWDKIAEDTVVGSGAFQGESFIYLAYVSKAMDGAVNPGQRNGQDADAAVAQAAYDVLVHYFPSQAANLTALHDAALAAVPDGAAKRNGVMYGDLAAAKVIRDRANDGLMTPIATTSPYTPVAPGPGVYRRTPPYAPAQTPWMANVQPFILDSASHFMPPPPPSLQSQEWVDAFNEVKSLGAANSVTRTAEQTATARFFAANVPRQFNRLARDIATNMDLDVPRTARLIAMLNEVGADAMISMMNAKYHFQFWRPITAIDPMSVTSDGLGPVPGFDDGNPLTVEQQGWTPLLSPTPNHPEYPSAHATITSAVGEVIARFMGTDSINIDLVGNSTFNAVRHYATVQDLRTEVSNARIWAGLHYRFSTVAGTKLGKEVADYDLDHAFNTGG